MKTLAAAVGVCSVWLIAQAPPPADLVLNNGHVITVDARDSIAQAVAIAGGKIAAVGTNDEVRARIGSRTRVIDLKGRTATPGLIDTHVHFSEANVLYAVDLSDAGIRTIDEVLRRVRAQVATLQPGEWVRGGGWDEGKLVERRYITAADLDKAAPNNPVWLMQTTGHYGVANSYALKMAEVRNDTKDPPAGTIDRDAQGRPSGVLKESAMALVSRLVPPFTREQQKQGLIRIIEDFNREGMTGAKDPGIGQQKWELYEELLKEGKLTVRMFALWSGARRAEDNPQVIARVRANPRPPASLGDGMLWSGGVKMFMDGSGGARTAWMHEDWNKNSTDIDTGNTGYPAMPPETYRQIVRALHDAGIHVSTHAIGDRAIDWVVDTYDQVLRAKPQRGLRHGIIHANTPTDHALDVMARLQREYDAGYPEAQAPFLWWIGDNYAANLGPARASRLEPFKSFVSRHIMWSGGSDYSVTPFPARYGLWSSVTRKTLNGTYGATPFGTAESIDIRTALRSYTLWAAHQMFLDDRIGSLEAGKDADIAVWDRDLYIVPLDQLKDLKCELTLVRGAIVYEAKIGGSAQSQPAETLSDAVLYGHMTVVESLIAGGADVNEKDAAGMTPLMVAASQGRAAIGQRLIKAGADVASRDQGGATALMRAASANRVEALNLLMANGADVNAKDGGGMTALMAAAYGGYVDAVRPLLAHKAEAGAKDNQGRTALMAAAANGEIAVVQALLAGSADVAASDAAGGTAATYAAASGQADILDALTKRGAKVGTRELMLAASECHTAAVRVLLTAGLTVNRNGDGDPPILVAAAGNCVDTVKLLLDKGADINARDHDGWTPLIKAASGGRTELARLLLDRGADMDVVDTLERTASMYAAMPGHEEIAALFKEARAKKR